MTTWQKEIEEAANGDVITHCTLSFVEMIKEFNKGFGCSEGEKFTAWSKEYVYFPCVYDGHEWVGRALRHPCDTSTEHIGME